MKPNSRLALLTTLFTLLAAPGAFATGAAGLSAIDAYEIRQFVPNADLTDLSPDQARALRRLLHDGDGLDTAYQIRSILLRGQAED